MFNKPMDKDAVAMISTLILYGFQYERLALHKMLEDKQDILKSTQKLTAHDSATHDQVQVMLSLEAIKALCFFTHNLLSNINESTPVKEAITTAADELINPELKKALITVKLS